MPRSLCRWFLLGLLVFPIPVSVFSSQDTDFMALQRRLTEIYEAHSGAVVRVKAAAEETGDDGNAEVALRVGSGFFISHDGHVLTNSSVAFGATRIWVEIDGVSYAADSLGNDPRTNLSLLKLMHLPPNLSYISMRSGVEMPPVGSLAIVISCPLEFDPSPALAMVSGHESSFSDRVFPVTYVRINVPAHPGEGGAPVLDLNGRLLGIIVASLPEVRSSYFLPVRAILRVRDDLLFSGEVKTGWIGVELNTRVNRIDGRHMIVEKVMPGSPAEEAGLVPGDTLLQMGEFEIRSPDDVRNAHFYHRIGEFVEMRLRREGEILTLPVKLRSRPQSPE